MQKTWEDYYQQKNYFHLQPHEALPGFLDLCSRRGIEKVLDMGCGAGADLLFMAERGFSVVGVDFSPAAATNAEDLLQSKNLSGKVYIDNLFDKVTTFTAKEFPAVVALNSLEYCELPTFITTIGQIVRILNDKGLLLLAVSSKESPVEIKVSEQVFFSEEELTEIVSKHFDILDFMRASNESLVLTLEKK
jgi:cyclopropane fatty-acyl-phospholipid synthase-like methyltransferase